MNTHVSRSAQNKKAAKKTQAVAHKVSQRKPRAEFTDARTELASQKRLQLLAHNNSQAEVITPRQHNSQQDKPIQQKAIQQKAIQQKTIQQKTIQQKAIQKKENTTGLPDQLKSGIENLSGYSMDDVNVHYNSTKPAQLQAHAFAQGTDIHLASGQEKHLPHEAWHVVQQKQGRVQPTIQMKKGVPINDNEGLEKEADLMGGKAMQMADRPASASLIQAPLRNDVAAIQGKWILRNGSPVQVNDDYVLQAGESDLDMSLYFQQPRIIFDEGNKIGKYDKTGKVTFEDFDSSKLPNHEDLQDTREKQGAELGKRLLASKGIKAEADKIEDLAKILEGLAGDNVPKNHADKISKLATKAFSEKQFRGVIKSQDEFSQSKATEALFKGLRSSLSGSNDPDVQRFLTQALRAFSSLRARTGSVSAPMTYNGNLVGQQHPTSFATHDKLPNGGSGHSYADRQRVSLQNQAFSDLAQHADVSASTLIVSNLLSALVATLSTMASPHTASNVPDFDTGFDDEQLKDREQIKKQTQTISSKFGFDTGKRKPQKLDKPYMAYEVPNSPLRDDGASSDDDSMIIDPPTTKKVVTPQMKPGGDTNMLSSSTTQSQLKLPSIEEFLRSLKLQKQQGDILQLINRIRGALPNGVITTPIWHQLAQVAANVQNVQINQPFDAFMLAQYYNQVVALYRQSARFITRGPANGHHQQLHGFSNITRVNALEQFMAECGQMAVHNVIAVQHAQNNNAFGYLNQNLMNTNLLAGWGNFDNNTDEGDIRNLLAQAGYQGIPVIGNLGQLQAFIRNYNTAEQTGQAMNIQGLGQHILQQMWHVGNIEMHEIIAMNDFIAGRTNQINFIINTDGHKLLSQGYHWITVRLERNQDGTIRLFFLDSLNGDNDYSALFAGLSAFINNQNVNPGAGNNDSTNKLSGHKTK